MSLSSSLASALEAMNPQRPATSDLSGSIFPDHPSITTVGSSNPLFSSSFSERVRKESVTEADPYRFSSGTVAASTASDLYGTKHARNFSPAFDQNMAGTRNANQAGISLSSGQDSRSFSRSSTTGNAGAYRESPRSETISMTHYMPCPNTNCNRNMTQLPQSCVSPVPPVSHMTETTPTTRMCPSSSPLSCSSLSNTGNSTANISPVLLPDGQRARCQMRDGDGLSCSDGKPGFHYTSQSRADCLREHEIKSEYPSSLGAYQDEPSRKREQRLIKNREAARECRRKKKEYVKCLEARVSLLESQNQELIEELQKVKALCFNELCGLGLNSSTAACAAAVLAAVTSGPGTHPAACTPTMSSVVKSSDRVIPDVTGHLSDQMPTSAPAVPMDDHSQTVTGHLDSTVRTSHRSRCQSILLDMKIPPVLGNGNDGGNNVAPQRSSVYHGVCDSTQSDRSYLHDDVEVKQDNQNASMTVHTPISADMTTGRISPDVVVGGIGAVYDSRAVGACDPYRTRSHVTPHNHQSPHLGGSSQSRRLDPSTYQQHSPPKVGTLMSPYALGSSTPSSTTTAATTTSTDSSYYHPHYAAKRAYRTMVSANPDVKPNLASSQRQPQQSDDIVSESTECRPKTNRPSNPVAGAAVILAAAAAAIVAESESSDPRISV
ncbi:cAMP-responsive element modulator [Fasciola gigantica]|uniref:cAMP-responsive element modulator n=1 Tax=Fasciola gigantica TaxID=46835 RepID=A0A504Z1T2_FASGI|nr:cAMP-responsive element modulator [Fasciola gigantica]